MESDTKRRPSLWLIASILCPVFGIAAFVFSGGSFIAVKAFVASLVAQIICACIGTFSRPMRNDWIATAWMFIAAVWLAGILLTGAW